MIVEFPKKICVDDFYRRAKIAAARDKVLANCGKITDNSWTKLAGLVTVTGVGFWDYRHGQIGVARTRSSSTRR